MGGGGLRSVREETGVLECVCARMLFQNQLLKHELLEGIGKGIFFLKSHFRGSLPPPPARASVCLRRPVATLELSGQF